jgi:transcriptional regulator with XRE-family HTH domain
MPNLHKKIIAIRKMRGLSQPQTAELANIPFRTYQRIESGETSISIDYLNRLAEGFQCSLNDILHFDLETKEFSVENAAELVQKNQVLEAENGRLRQFVNWQTEKFPGEGRNEIQIAYWLGFAESYLNLT